MKISKKFYSLAAAALKFSRSFSLKGVLNPNFKPF